MGTDAGAFGSHLVEEEDIRNWKKRKQTKKDSCLTPVLLVCISSLNLLLRSKLRPALLYYIWISFASLYCSLLLALDIKISSLDITRPYVRYSLYVRHFNDMVPVANILDKGHEHMYSILNTGNPLPNGWECFKLEEMWVYCMSCMNITIYCVMLSVITCCVSPIF